MPLRPLRGIAATIMAACLFGCGGGDSPDAAPVDPPSAVEPPPAEPPPAASPEKTVWPAIVREENLAAPLQTPYGETLLIRDRETLLGLFPWFPTEAPAEIRDPDFSKMWFLRLTGWPERLSDWFAVTPRVERIETSADGLRHVVHLEYCRYAQDMLSPITQYVPVTLYQMPALPGEVAFEWADREYYRELDDPDRCRTKMYPTYGQPHSATTAPLDATRRWALRLAGDVYGWSSEALPPTVISEQAYADWLMLRVDPAQRAALQGHDFSRSWLLFLQAADTLWRHDGYIRIESIESSGSVHVVRLEACGVNPGVKYSEGPVFAIYEIPALIGERRFEWVRRDPPNCQQPR